MSAAGVCGGSSGEVQGSRRAPCRLWGRCGHALLALGRSNPQKAAAMLPVARHSQPGPGIFPGHTGPNALVFPRAAGPRNSTAQASQLAAPHNAVPASISTTILGFPGAAGSRVDAGASRSGAVGFAHVLSGFHTKHTWRSHHNTVFWCNLKLAQRKGLRFYQTRSHAITLSDTLRAICIDKVFCMKTREELYCRIYKSPRLPRVTLVPNSQHVQKDVLAESRESHDCENEAHQHRETWGSDQCVDFLIPGVPHSAVEQVEKIEKKKFDD